MQNFAFPYFSRDIAEFWRRWHISLSTWLKDYLYIPLGGNRGGMVRTNINLMATMLLGGLWHGASWNFVLWGGLHGFYLILNKIIRRYKAQRKSRRVINYLYNMKTTLKEEIKKNRELMGVIKESKDDKVNLSLAAAYEVIVAADEELGSSLSDWIKNNAKTTSVVLNHNVITPSDVLTAPGKVTSLGK